MSHLLEAQLQFGEEFPELLLKMLGAGFNVKIDETGRGACQAEINALTTAQRTHLAALIIGDFSTLARAIQDLKPGVRGIRSSLHVDRCAGDVILFQHGVPVWAPEAYRPFGEWWMGLGELFHWGGSFQDYDHFSRSPEGDSRK